MPKAEKLNYLTSHRGPEVALCEKMRVENWYSYHTCYVVNCSVFAKAKKSRRDDLAALVKQHDGLIKDKLRSVIASVNPEDIKDPHLEVVKRKLKYTMDGIVGNGLMEEILIPEWMSFRSR